MGITRRFENGIVSVNHKKFMGYTKDENGELVIVPEEAEYNVHACQDTKLNFLVMNSFREFYAAA